MKQFFISEQNPAYIIAEIGVNHGGSIETAFQLIDEAYAAGVDAVKFQAYKADRLASRVSPSYWDLSEEPTESQHELFSKYDLFGLREYQLLHDYSLRKGLEFMLTCFDLDFVKSLAHLSPIMKIASADITNIPLLLAVGESADAIVLSTGAATIQEVQSAINMLEPFKKPISLLHCVLNYPTPHQNAFMSRINILKSHFPYCVIGYSDHTKPIPGNPILNSAFVLGARVFEKHFSNSLGTPGNDHYHSMDTKLMSGWLSELSDLNRSLDYNEVDFLNSQGVAIRNARRGIYASRQIASGELFTEMNLTTLRPSSSTPAEKWLDVIGRVSRRDLREGDAIQESDYLP